MKKVYLIACGSKKINKAVKAEELYQSYLFKKSLAYAKLQKPAGIYILSAKYGLVQLSDTIETYDCTLNAMSINEKKSWAETVIEQLNKCVDVQKDKFVFLAGEQYRKYLLPYLNLNNVEIPMKGKKIGEQLQWLTQQIS